MGSGFEFVAFRLSTTFYFYLYLDRIVYIINLFRFSVNLFQCILIFHASLLNRTKLPLLSRTRQT